MKNYTFDWEIQTISTMLLNALSEIVIKRYNVDKEPQDQIKIRIVYAPKQRVLADLLDKDQNLQLPVMAVYIGGISRDPNRVFNKVLGTYKSNTGTTVTNEPQPLPIDINYNVTIATRYQSDMDQILSNFLPYVNPYFVISWRTPGRPDYEIRSSVYWNGNVSISYPFDIAASQVAKVVADLSFTFKGWLFQSLNQDATNIIHTVHTTYNSSSRSIPVEYLLETNDRVSSEIKDYLVIEGVPPQPKTIEPYYAYVGQTQQFNTFGSGYAIINNVYLSGLPLSANSTLFNPFSSVPKLSAQNPPFTAVKLLSTQWSYNRDNFMTFVMPSATNAGRVDLIVEGPAGYGTLTESVRLNTFNPFVSTDSCYQIFVPYQMPYLSGIEVRN